jgi:Flp pilus assembly protein protease CpaA
MLLHFIPAVICLLWASAIALIDLLTYRVSNSSLIWGLVVVWPSLYLMKQNFSLGLKVLTFAFVTVLIGLSNVLGMGDVKLLLFMAPWLHFQDLQNPALVLIGLSWLQLTLEVVVKRKLPQRIALAPAILAAAALNLAT